MTDLLLSYLQNPILHKVATSLLFIIALGVIKSALTRALRKHGKRQKTNYRSQVNTLRNTINISSVIIILAIWSSEIGQFAFSIAAFIFAIVFATKEYIQCVVGYAYYLSARPFRIGDWIQLSEGVGEVISVDWAKVTMLEVDLAACGYTGKHLLIPNNQLVLKSVKNLNFLRRYALSQFTITCEPTLDVTPIIEKLKEKAVSYTQHFHEVAERYKNLIEKRMDIEFIEVKPHIAVHTNQFAKICITIDLFCPVEENIALQQKITAEFFSMWHKESNELILKIEEEKMKSVK